MKSDDNRDRKTDMISVIIPVYNTAPYLERCIDSILKNDYQNLEIICINDGSTDDSLTVLKKLQSNNKRIIVIDVPHGGVSKARNIGLDRATGDYICFIDSDDWIHHRFFNTMMHYASKNNAAWVFSDFRETQSEIPDLSIEHIENLPTCSADIDSPNGSLAFSPFGKQTSTVWGGLYRKDIVENIRFEEDVKIREDVIFNYEVMSCNRRFNAVFIDFVLYYYYQGTNSSTSLSEFSEQEAFFEYFVRRGNEIANRSELAIWLKKVLQIALYHRYLCLLSKQSESTQHAISYVNDFWIIEQNNKVLSRTDRIKYRIYVRYPTVYKIKRTLLIGYKYYRQDKVRIKKGRTIR